MAQVIADRRDIDFVLFEQFAADTLSEHEKYAEFNRKTIGLIIDEARNLAVKEILPTFVEGDREGAVFDNGAVKLPESFHRAFKLLVEGEWTAMTADPELGGQGLPYVVAQAVSDYLLGANYAFTLYGWGGYGAGEMIEIFGTEKQKDLFLKKMYTGLWGGTMVLTEPGAGSDVGALTTTAVKNDDGTYTISGNKIFITGAENDLVENIIHPVLARIEGAPAGTKGISLFIVPKIWVNEDGSLGEPNDVVCTGIEEKMGIHGSATCSMTFGGKGKCRGLLLGEENKGMRIMFHMMNMARLLVGSIGFTSASTAYMYAVNYARERRQGRDLEKTFEPDAPQVPIMHHPDVRRMLLEMKAYVEGMRSLLYFGALRFDKQTTSSDPEEQAYHADLLDLLNPVIKAYCSDKGFELCSQAMQVYGGYGYTCDYPIEQLLRDVRIAAIYEGTNGIQAMDLLARKLGMKKGAVFMNFLGEVLQVTARAKDIEELKAFAEAVEKAANRLGETAMHMGQTAMSKAFKTAFAHATPFLEVMGDVIMAWMLLWRAAVAAENLAKLTEGKTGEERMRKIAKNRKAAFYDGQIKSADFFINNKLPIAMGKMDAIAAAGSAAVDILDASFGG